MVVVIDAQLDVFLITIAYVSVSCAPCRPHGCSSVLGVRIASYLGERWGRCAYGRIEPRRTVFAAAFGLVGDELPPRVASSSSTVSIRLG